MEVPVSPRHRPYEADDPHPGSTIGAVARALASGAAGALALTTVHQLAVERLPNAPRMDIVGLRALDALLRAARIRLPSPRALYTSTLAGDLAANSLYYATVGALPNHPVAAGASLGLVAGIGALTIPPAVGLGSPPHAAAWSNRLMTIAWYTLGGLVAGAAYRGLQGRRAA
jgi:hypothetical protein